MQDPLISVIVPVYKTEAFLRKCLDSIIHQTYRNLEIICVDDGSPDKCGEILEEYARLDTRIKVIHQPNGGVSVARNNGLAVATGDWVTGVDSDDYLEPDIYQKAVDKLSDKIDILVFGTRIVYEPGLPPDSQVESYFVLPDEGFLPSGDTQSSHLNCCIYNKLWRHSLIRDHHVSFPVGTIQEDEYFFRCLTPLARGVYILPHIGYNYVQRASSYMHSTRSTREKYQVILSIIDRIIRFHIETGSLVLAKEYILPFWVNQLNKIGQQQERTRAQRMNRAIITRYNLAQAIPHDLRLLQLQNIPWWKRHFFQLIPPNRCSYKFFSIPLFSVMYENNLPHHLDSAWLNLLRRLLRITNRRTF